MNVGQVEVKSLKISLENALPKKKCNGSLIRKQCTPMPQTCKKKISAKSLKNLQGFCYLCIALLPLLLASMTIEWGVNVNEVPDSNIISATWNLFKWCFSALLNPF